MPRWYDRHSSKEDAEGAGSKMAIRRDRRVREEDLQSFENAEENPADSREEDYRQEDWASERGDREEKEQGSDPEEPEEDPTEGDAPIDEEEQQESEEESPQPQVSSRSRKSSKSGLSSQPKPPKNDFVNKMREMLKKIFHFYASFGNRCNTKFLKPSQFIKMMVDSDISDGALTQTKLDILFLQACKKSKTLEFEDFLELLLLVAGKKVKREPNPDKAFRQLLVQFLQPLHDRILAETDVGVEDKILHSPLNVSTLLVLKMITKPLQALYKHYFEWEINRPLQEKPSLAKVETELFAFLKDFEVCPQLIPKSAAYSLFNQILATKSEDLCRNHQYQDLEKILGKDLGENFTFFRFVVYLGRVGIYIFSDVNNVPTTHRSTGFSVDEKVYLLLERLDISNGISKLTHLLQKDKAGPQGQHKLSLMRDSLLHIHRETGAYPNFFDSAEEEPKENRLSQIIKANRQKKIGKDRPESEEDEFMYIKMAKRLTKNKLGSGRSGTASAASVPRKSGSKPFFANVRSNKENLPEYANKDPTLPAASDDSGPNLLLPESYDTCETYLDELHKIFEVYCSFGEPGNYNALRPTKFLRLMKDAKVFDSKEGSVALETQEVDLIYCSILHGIDPFSTQSKKKAKALLLKFKSEDDANRSTSPLRSKPSTQGMGFSLFLQCLEAVAICTEKDLEKPSRLAHFIERRLVPLLHQKPGNEGKGLPIGKKIESTDHFAAKLMSVLRDRTMVEILSVVHKTMLPLYSLYCDDNKLLTVKKFLQFMKDFGVFPQVISQVKLHQLFHELSTLFKNKSSGSEPREAAIDQHLFVEGLTLVALEVEYEKFKLTNAQKLILLLERMNDSDATQKLSRYLGRTISKKFDIVSQVRQKFSEHFRF